MRTIKELIGEERNKLPKTVRDTSLFVKEIIERYGQGGQNKYKFDPASLVYFLPAVPEKEESKHEPAEERVREYLIRERDIQKLEIREKRGRDFAQRIVQSIRLPGARELLRKQSVKQQLSVWLKEIVREYQNAEQEQIRSLLEHGELREVFERVIREKDVLGENHESLRSRLEKALEPGETLEAQAEQLLSDRQEQLHRLLDVTEEAMRLVYIQRRQTQEEKGPEARRSKKQESNRSQSQGRETGQPNLPMRTPQTEYLTETLSKLEEVFIRLRRERLHVEQLQSYHEELERLQELTERWRHTDAGQEERNRGRIRESLRRIQLQRERLEEYILREERQKGYHEELERLQELTERWRHTDAGQEESSSVGTEQEDMLASVEEGKTGKASKKERDSLIPEESFDIGEVSLKYRTADTVRTENTVQEIEERIRSELRRKKEEVTESVKETTAQKIVDLIVQELSILPLIGRMNEDARSDFWSSLNEGEFSYDSEDQKKVLRKEGAKSPEQSVELARQLLLGQMTREEFWKVESKVLEKHGLSEEERNHLALLERQIIHRSLLEHWETESKVPGRRELGEEERNRLDLPEQQMIYRTFLENSSEHPLENHENHIEAKLQRREQNDSQKATEERLSLLEQMELIERQVFFRQEEEYAGEDRVRQGLTGDAPEGTQPVYRIGSQEQENGLSEGDRSLRYRRESEEDQTKREQERFSYRTEAVEKEKTERLHNEQQRQLRTLQETARLQEEKLAVMEKEQKRLTKQLAKAQEEAGSMEEEVMRKMQSQLRLEQLRRGLI